EGAAELLDAALQVQTGLVQQHVPDQGVAVGVQTGGGHRDHGVTRTDAVGAEEQVGLHHAGAGPGDVEVVLAQQARVLGGLAADQRAAGQHTALGDALDDGGDPLGVDLADADVVGHEQRFGTAHHDVVHHHGDQVVADGVVDAHAPGDVDLGAHAVGGGGQQG